MDRKLREKLLDWFDAAPASVDEYRAIMRRLFEHLSLSTEEAEIMAWDANGRNPADFDRLRVRAWGFKEVGDAECRRRLFAGFVTNGDLTDGYGADYLIDFAMRSGISTDDVCAAMIKSRPGVWDSC